MTQLPFRDRADAGRQLSAELIKYKFPADVIVLALPRGGLPVGFEVASALHAPLDAVVVRKLGVPWQPELAMGAIAGASVEVLDRELIASLGISQQDVDEVLERERAEVRRREKLYRRGRPALKLHSRTVLLVDDGLATGSTMLVAVQYVRTFRPARIFIAVPVSSLEARSRLQNEVDDFVCLATPAYFAAVGEWYIDFRQVNDAEVQDWLERNRRQMEASKTELRAAR